MKHIFSMVAICILIIGFGSNAYATREYAANPDPNMPCWKCHSNDPVPAPPDHTNIVANCLSCHNPIKEKSNPFPNGAPSSHFGIDVAAACGSCHDDGRPFPPTDEGVPTQNHSGFTANYPNSCTGCHGENGYVEGANGWILTAPAPIDNDKDGVSKDKDCNDNDADVYPGHPEVCDGKDNDCDGVVDNNAVDEESTTCGTGACAGNTGMMECTQGDLVDTCDPLAGATPEICDKIDNDCDGQIDEGLNCGCFPGDPDKTVTCGEGACKVTVTESCVNGHYTDTCVPGNPVAEICGDDVDNNCDGEVDDGCPAVVCTAGEEKTISCGVGECHNEVTLVCTANGQWPDVQCQPKAGGAEVCGDGLDNDCDNVVDNGCPTVVCTPSEEKTISCGVGECHNEVTLVCTADGQWPDEQCQPKAAGVEICGDGLDNDCDGKADEVSECPKPICDAGAEKSVTCGVGACAVTVTETCTADGQWTDTCVPNEPTEEICDDGIDNDCDGRTDGKDTECGSEPGPGGCDAQCPLKKESGTLTVSCSNFPEDAVAVKVVLYPSWKKVTDKSSRTVWASEGFVILRPDGSQKALISVSDRANPAEICGGKYKAVVKVYYTGDKPSAMTDTPVVIDGDSALELDYSKLNLE